MPIPKPTGSETEDEYMKRCMADSTMVSEYGKNQRTAVCLATYKGKGVDMTEEIKESYEEEVENSVEVETKYLALNCEWKMPDDEEDDKYKGTFSGYASVFGNKDLGGDVVVRGAFRESLRKRKQRTSNSFICTKQISPLAYLQK